MIYRSRNGKVIIEYVRREDSILIAKGRVKSTSRLYFNLWLVFLISGLWHGAAWSFVFWGAYHGLFLILERGFLLKFYERIGRLPSTLITFVIVMIGWVFFRVEDFSRSIQYVKRMFTFSSPITIESSIQFYTFAGMAVFFSFFTMFKNGQKVQDAVYFNNYEIPKHIAMFVISNLLLVLSLSYIVSSGFNPFIYFRF